MAPRITVWTGPRTEELCALWDANDLSASEIATQLGGGLTRNAVLGKAHRMGLEDHSEKKSDPKSDECRQKISRSRKLRWAMSKAKNPPSTRPLPVFTPIPDPLDVSIVDLKLSHCKYITGKDQNNLATYCGHEVLKQSFCAGHFRLCYHKVRAVSQEESIRRRLAIVKRKQMTREMLKHFDTEAA